MEGVSRAQGKLSWKLPETQEPKAPHDGRHRGPEARAVALQEQDARPLWAHPGLRVLLLNWQDLVLVNI